MDSMLWAALGARGVLTNGGTRDSDETLSQKAIPIWSRWIVQPMYQGRVEWGGHSVPVEIGGQLVRPDDLVVADGDGAIVVPVEVIDDVLKYAIQEAENDRKARGMLFDRLGIARDESTESQFDDVPPHPFAFTAERLDALLAHLLVAWPGGSRSIRSAARGPRRQSPAMTSHDSPVSHRPSCRTSSTPARGRSPPSPQRVRKAIAELGYRPDASRPVTAPRPQSRHRTRPPRHHQPVLRRDGTSRRGRGDATGYAVLICTTSDDMERERAHIVNLASRRVDGLILMSARPDQDLSGFTGLGIPVVAMDRSPDDSPVSTIRVDNALGARLGTKHLIEHGHKRIAIVAGPVATGVSRSRVKGFQRAMSAAGLSRGQVVEAAFDFQGGHRAGHALLTMPDHPDALLISSDVQAIGVLSAAAELGRRVPEDLAVVSFDGTRAGAFAVPVSRRSLSRQPRWPEGRWTSCDGPATTCFISHSSPSWYAEEAAGAERVTSTARPSPATCRPPEESDLSPLARGSPALWFRQPAHLELNSPVNPQFDHHSEPRRRFPMATVDLDSLDKIYENGFHAIHELTLDIADKEFLVLVGPSGCGKSTALRMVAGLETISGGTMKIGDRVVNDVEPKDRDIAMVFQNYALYPHMTVFDNIGFALKLAGVPKQEIDTRVRKAAAILELDKHLDRKPGQLSGGQRQRVAMGRAIVRQPAVFLMDEPLSNLDAKLRVQMRAEIAAPAARPRASPPSTSPTTRSRR